MSSTDGLSTTPAGRSRAGRNASRDALEVLEDALAAPTPGREHDWRNKVIDALNQLIATLETQSELDLGDNSLLTEIGNEDPRLLPRIRRLHHEHQDLRTSAASLHAQMAGSGDDSPADIDTADIRDRLAALGQRFRQHRAREADLVYEAVNIDLGAGD